MDYGDKSVYDDELLDDEDTQKDKYLTFKIAKEDYGIEIRYVLEIIGMQKITEVPDMPNYIKGVINLRGKIIPVIDVRLRFHLPEKAYGDRTCIIVVDINGKVVGLIVDEVSEVLMIPSENLEEAPSTTKGSKSRYIKGIGKVGELVKIILDVEKLLLKEEMELIENINEK